MAWERYFDNAATTPVDPRVLDEMLPYLRDDFGNANSIHSPGAKARRAVERARERVAELVGAEDPAQIVFTSGATESNNWVISSQPSGFISPFEHSAVREPALQRGMQLLQNAGLTCFKGQAQVDFLSIMSVNNEIGTQWCPQQFRLLTAVLHSDMTQQLGKLPIDIADLDYASFSAHKLYGPKGIGALYFASEAPLPYMAGGEQESGVRAGTLNVPGIVGFGAACAVAADEMERDRAHAVEMRAAVLEELANEDSWQVNGGEQASPYILSLSFRGLQGESLVIDADAAGYAISAGAACSSRSTEPSHVLEALGLEPEWLRGTIRVSFGRFNTVEAAQDLAKTLKHSIQKLRRMF